MDRPLTADVWSKVSSELTALSSFARARETDDDAAQDACLHLPVDSCDHRTYRCAECCPHDT